MSLKTKLAKSAKKTAIKKALAKHVKKVASAKAEKVRKPRPKKSPKPAERRKAPRSQEVLALFRKDGSVVPGAEWVIAGQGVAHPLGALDEVLQEVPRTQDGLREYFTTSPLKGILFDGGPGSAVGVLREDLGL